MKFNYFISLLQKIKNEQLIKPPIFNQNIKKTQHREAKQMFMNRKINQSYHQQQLPMNTHNNYYYSQKNHNFSPQNQKTYPSTAQEQRQNMLRQLCFKQSQTQTIKHSSKEQRHKKLQTEFNLFKDNYLILIIFEQQKIKIQAQSIVDDGQLYKAEYSNDSLPQKIKKNLLHTNTIYSNMYYNQNQISFDPMGHLIFRQIFEGQQPKKILLPLKRYVLTQVEKFKRKAQRFEKQNKKLKQALEKMKTKYQHLLKYEKTLIKMVRDNKIEKEKDKYKQTEIIKFENVEAKQSNTSKKQTKQRQILAFNEQMVNGRPAKPSYYTLLNNNNNNDHQYYNPPSPIYYNNNYQSQQNGSVYERFENGNNYIMLNDMNGVERIDKEIIEIDLESQSNHQQFNHQNEARRVNNHDNVNVIHSLSKKQMKNNKKLLKNSQQQINFIPIIQQQISSSYSNKNKQQIKSQIQKSIKRSNNNNMQGSLYDFLINRKNEESTHMNFQSEDDQTVFLKEKFTKKQKNSHKNNIKVSQSSYYYLNQKINGWKKYAESIKNQQLNVFFKTFNQNFTPFKIKQVKKPGINIQTMAFVQLFANLTELDLSDNQIKQIQNLENCPKLKILNLSCNQIKKMEGLQNVRQLKQINLKQNQIQKIQFIFQLKKLQILNLQSNNITQITNQISQLTSLRQVYLNDNNIRKIPQKLGQLTSLKVFRINDNLISLQNEDSAGRENKKVLDNVMYENSNVKIFVENMFENYKTEYAIPKSYCYTGIMR